MPRLLYSLLLSLAMPLLVLRLFLRSLKAPAYRRRIIERFGMSLPDRPGQAQTLVWIHAVSVGEVAAAEPLVRELQAQATSPAILITTMTPTGSERASGLLNEQVLHCYLPYDLPFLLQPLFRKLKPDVLVLMETELWPNLVSACRRNKVKLMLANARLSEKSANGYRRIAGLTREMLQSVDVIAAQAEADAKRLIDLGANESKVVITGSLKFHISTHAANKESDELFVQIKASGRPVMIAASTRAGEEAILLPAFFAIQKVIPDILFIVVPRHPERFAVVADLLDQHSISYRRRSEHSGLDSATTVLLGDSMGELSAYLACADIAFVGGSLVNTGCQNVLEPAALGIPVLVGPSQFNFATICQQLQEAGALLTVQDARQLAECATELLKSTEQRERMSAAGQAVITANQQALPAQLALIQDLIKAG